MSVQVLHQPILTSSGNKCFIYKIDLYNYQVITVYSSSLCLSVYGLWCSPQTFIFYFVWVNIFIFSSNMSHFLSRLIEEFTFTFVLYVYFFFTSKSSQQTSNSTNFAIENKHCKCCSNQNQDSLSICILWKLTYNPVIIPFVCYLLISILSQAQRAYFQILFLTMKAYL